MIGSSVFTVERSSVAKWPDKGATTSTRGCWAEMSFLKCSRVAKGVTSAASSVTAAIFVADQDALDVVGGARVGKSGAVDHLVSGGKIAHQRVFAKPA